MIILDIFFIFIELLAFKITLNFLFTINFRICKEEDPEMLTTGLFEPYKSRALSYVRHVVICELRILHAVLA